MAKLLLLDVMAQHQSICFIPDRRLESHSGFR
jgi:hypothetical protein